MSNSRISDGEVDIFCTFDNLQSFASALSSIKWKREQDAVCELSEHGLIFVVEDLHCLHAKLYFRKELFGEYRYHADVRLRFAVSLSVLVDVLNAFSSSNNATVAELRYPGSDMQLLLKVTDANDTITDAEIRTQMPESIPRDYSLREEGQVSFAVRSHLLKEAMEDLEWPGASVQLSLKPQPPTVTLRAEGQGSLQIEFCFDRSLDLFIEFNCDHEVTFWYKYKFLSATIANIPNNILKDNRGSKMTIDSSGLLKVQHIINLKTAETNQGGRGEGGGGGQAPKTSYIEFFVMPEEETEGGEEGEDSQEG